MGRIILRSAILVILTGICFTTTVFALSEGFGFSGGYAVHNKPDTRGLGFEFSYQAPMSEVATFNAVFQRSSEGPTGCSGCPNSPIDFFGFQIRF